MDAKKDIFMAPAAVQVLLWLALQKRGQRFRWYLIQVRAALARRDHRPADMAGESYNVSAFMK